VLGADLFMLGEFVEARRHLERALALYDPTAHRNLRFAYAYDSRVVSAMYLAWTDFVLGYPQRAARLCRVTLAEARKLGHPVSFAYALDSACTFHQLARDRKEVKRHAAALFSLSQQQDYAFWRAQAEMYRGWAVAEGADAATGMAALRAGIAAHQSTGGEIFIPYHLAMMAELQSTAGDHDGALASLAEAMTRIGPTAERWFEAELHRREAEIGLRAGRIGPEQAEVILNRALACARLQNARMWELRAATDLARLWQSHGKSADARSALGPVLGWFPEGEAADDLQAAPTLLAGLDAR
jgi:predicted ATPase